MRVSQAQDQMTRNELETDTSSRSSSRTRKSLLNIATSSLSSLALMLFGLGTTPILVGLLGPERFGGARALTDLFGYISLFDLGLSGSIMAVLGPAVGRGDSSAVKGILSTGSRIYFWVTILMAIAGGVILIFLPSLITVRKVSKDELLIAGVICILPTLLSVSGVFRALVEAKQNGFLITIALTLQLVMATVLSILFAIFHLGLPGQMAAAAISQLPFAIWLVWVGIRDYPNFWRFESKSAVKKQILNLNWPTFLFSASGRLGLLSDNIVIAWGLGAAMVAPFFLTQRLISITQTQLQNVGNATWAGLVQLHATGQSDLLRARFLEITSFLTGIGFAILGPLIAYNKYFVQHWVGPKNYGGIAVTVLCATNALLQGLFSFWAWPISGTGHINRLAPYSFAAMVLNVIVSLGATLLLGLPGPLVGTLASFVLVNSWAYPKVLNELFGISHQSLWKANFSHLRWGLPYVVTNIFVGYILAPSSWVTLCLEIALSTAVGLGLMWTFGLDLEERGQWRTRLTLKSKTSIA